MTTRENPPSPLTGVRVLDLTRVLAGPLCTMMLGDLGADVIKVERPGAGDDTRQWGPPWAEGPRGRESAYFLAVNRNKRSLVADLKAEPDRTLVQALAREADVLVENFVSGTMERHDLGYESLAALNPGLIYCSITGYGGGEDRDERGGYDFAVQAEAGWMSITGEPGGEPVKVGVAVIDVLAGQNAAVGILAALNERQRSGLGQRVGVTLFDSALAGLVNVAQSALVGAEPGRYGNAHASIVPYQAFEAADRPVVIAVGNDGQWSRLCSALDVPGLATDPRYATNPRRVENRLELLPLLAARVRERPAAAWIARFEEAGIPCALVRTVAEAMRDARAAGSLWSFSGTPYGKVESVASPLHLARTPAGVRRPAPALGEHSAEISGNHWAGE